MFPIAPGGWQGCKEAVRCPQRVGRVFGKPATPEWSPDREGGGGGDGEVHVHVQVQVEDQVISAGRGKDGGWFPHPPSQGVRDPGSGIRAEEGGRTALLCGGEWGEAHNSRLSASSDLGPSTFNRADGRLAGRAVWGERGKALNSRLSASSGLRHSTGRAGAGAES